MLASFSSFKGFCCKPHSLRICMHDAYAYAWSQGKPFLFLHSSLPTHPFISTAKITQKWTVMIERLHRQVYLLFQGNLACVAFLLGEKKGIKRKEGVTLLSYCTAYNFFLFLSIQLPSPLRISSPRIGKPIPLTPILILSSHFTLFILNSPQSLICFPNRVSFFIYFVFMRRLSLQIALYNIIIAFYFLFMSGEFNFFSFASLVSVDNKKKIKSIIEVSFSNCTDASIFFR